MNPKLSGLMTLYFFVICCSAGAEDLAQLFVDPPLRYATRPLWFWNNTMVTEAGIVQQMQTARDTCGYGGFGILPFGKGFLPTYSHETEGSTDITRVKIELSPITSLFITAQQGP